MKPCNIAALAVICLLLGVAVTSVARADTGPGNTTTPTEQYAATFTPPTVKAWAAKLCTDCGDTVS